MSFNRPSSRRGLAAVVASLLIVVLWSCGGGARQGGGHQDHKAPKALGEPAEESEADRSIDVGMLDALKFEPNRIEVAAGEVVTFVVKNQGALAHEFVLGDAELQKEHAKEMAKAGAKMEDSENAIRVPPSETKKLTWRFTEAGEVLFGCHEPGHYDGGMVGTIVVE